MLETPGLALLSEVGRLGALRREMAACTAPDLHPGAAGVLLHLAENEPQRMKQVAADLHLDLSGVSRAVSELVTAGQVGRTTDATDGRACLLSVTPAGHAALATVTQRIEERFAERIAACAPQDLERLTADLRRLRATFLPTASDGCTAV
jgi:DNA-binding MarR family transcriptional regulator